MWRRDTTHGWRHSTLLRCGTRHGQHGWRSAHCSDARDECKRRSPGQRGWCTVFWTKLVGLDPRCWVPTAHVMGRIRVRYRAVECWRHVRSGGAPHRKCRHVVGHSRATSTSRQTTERSRFQRGPSVVRCASPVWRRHRSNCIAMRGNPSWRFPGPATRVDDCTGRSPGQSACSGLDHESGRRCMGMSAVLRPASGPGERTECEVRANRSSVADHPPACPARVSRRCRYVRRPYRPDCHRQCR